MLFHVFRGGIDCDMRIEIHAFVTWCTCYARMKIDVEKCLVRMINGESKERSENISDVNNRKVRCQ